MQSVELLLDDDAERAVRGEWAALAAARLPTEQRTTPSSSHRPHITLWAGHELLPGADAALPGVVAGLDLGLRVGALTCFGPGPGRPTLVLVRQVVVSASLLALQARVRELCGPGSGDQFEAGCWVPHVTLAHRVRTCDLPAVVDVLAAGAQAGERPTRVTRARRWDGTAKREWRL